MNNKFSPLLLVAGCAMFGLGLDFNSSGLLYGGMAAAAVGFFGWIA